MLLNKQFVQKNIEDTILVSGDIPEDPHFSIDTRTLNRGDIFIALHGKQTDGHNFIEDALQKGASGIIAASDKKSFLKDIAAEKLKNKFILLVPNTLKALVRLATAWRQQFEYPVVAITGSVGKTSTKELLAHILDCNKNNYLASSGNQNTEVGISLNILKMRPHHQGAIFEVGINKRNEMKKLAHIIKPTTAIITNVGHSHMEGLGTLQDIAQEKRDIFSCFSEKSIGIIIGDQELLARVAYTHPVIKFGSKTTNQIQARKIAMHKNSATFTLKIYKRKYAIEVKRPHIGSVFNALAATATACYLGVPDDVIIHAIQNPPVVAGRFEPRAIKPFNSILIDDCYNANPESMKAALLAFENMESRGQKIAVLGDMLELGINSPFWHRQLGRFLRKVPSLKHVILVGSMVKWTNKTVPLGLSVEMVPSWQDAVEKLHQQVDKESTILVKGSLGVGLGNLVKKFVKE